MAVTVSTLAERALRRLGVTIVPIDDAPVFTEYVSIPVIARTALIELGVIGADELPSNDDQTLMEDKVKSVHAALDAKGAVWWTGIDGMPRAFVEEYAKLAAANAASSFGKAAGDLQVVAALEGRIRAGVMRFSAHDIALEGVMATHLHLTARGIARWTVFDIPPAVELPYEIITANMIAPKFEQQSDAQAMALATRSILQVIALGTSGERVRVEYF